MKENFYMVYSLGQLLILVVFHEPSFKIAVILPFGLADIFIVNSVLPAENNKS